MPYRWLTIMLLAVVGLLTALFLLPKRKVCRAGTGRQRQRSPRRQARGRLRPGRCSPPLHVPR